jgi:hypothetical protein
VITMAKKTKTKYKLKLLPCIDWAVKKDKCKKTHPSKWTITGQHPAAVYPDHETAKIALRAYIKLQKENPSTKPEEATAVGAPTPTASLSQDEYRE